MEVGGQLFGVGIVTFSHHHGLTVRLDLAHRVRRHTVGHKNGELDTCLGQIAAVSRCRVARRGHTELLHTIFLEDGSGQRSSHILKGARTAIQVVAIHHHFTVDAVLLLSDSLQIAPFFHWNSAFAVGYRIVDILYWQKVGVDIEALRILRLQ